MDLTQGVQGLTKQSWLAPTSLCGASGAVSAQPATGCTLQEIEASGADSAPDILGKFQSCASSTTAYLVQSLEIALKDGTSMTFCNEKILTINIENMQDTIDASITIAASTDDVATPITAEVVFVGYRASGCSNGEQVLAIDILTDAPGGQVSSYGNTNVYTFPTRKINEGIITYETECIDVCATEKDGQYALHATVLESQGAQTRTLTLNMDVKVKGTPCANTPDTLERGDVTLTLFGVSKASTVTCASVDVEDRQTAPEVVKSKVCAVLGVERFEQSTLQVRSERLTRQAPGAAAQVINNLFFMDSAGAVKDLSQGDGEKISSKTLQLDEDDAFATYTLVIEWEQKLADSRRRLRSTHIFGAGDHESIASLVILPSSAQIEDAVESLDAHETQGDNETQGEETEPVAPSPEAEDEGLSGGLSGDVIAGIIAGSAAGVGLIAYTVMQVQGGRRVSRQESAGYSAVRRSERFSTMNF